jgi:hypothetical protein
VGRLKKNGYNEDVKKMETDNFQWLSNLTGYYDQTCLNHDHSGLEEEYLYISALENTIDLVKKLNSSSINKIVDMYENYYLATLRIDIDPMYITDFIEYIAENLLDEDLSPIEIEEGVEEY